MKKTAQKIILNINYLTFNRLKGIIDNKYLIINNRGKAAGFTPSRASGPTGFTPSRASGQTGFTLIEMLVAATILATLAGGVFLSLNPIGQINKSQDAQRQADLQAIKVALDLYYNDNECYPANGEIPFGNDWIVRDAQQNETVYMKKVPQDPKCKTDDSFCYRYRTDTSACPQWNILFAKLTREAALANACALSTLSEDCTPEGYEQNVYACTMSGAVNCQSLNLATIAGSGEESVSPTATPTPIPSATPTPTPTPPAGSVTYSFNNPDNSDPDIYEATIMPLYANPGTGQAIRILADSATSDIVRMDVILYSDGDAEEFRDIALKTGTRRNGTWEGAWVVENTYNQVPGKQYGYDITATDDQGRTKTASIRVNREN